MTVLTCTLVKKAHTFYSIQLKILANHSSALKLTFQFFKPSAHVCPVQKYKEVNEDTSKSEPCSPQSSSHSRSPSPDDVLERVAADVKAYEQENLDTFEANIKAKHNLLTQDKDGMVYYVARLIRT